MMATGTSDMADRAVGNGLGMTAAGAADALGIIAGPVAAEASQVIGTIDVCTAGDVERRAVTVRSEDGGGGSGVISGHVLYVVRVVALEKSNAVTG